MRELVISTRYICGQPHGQEGIAWVPYSSVKAIWIAPWEGKKPKVTRLSKRATTSEGDFQVTFIVDTQLLYVFKMSATQVNILQGRLLEFSG